MNWYATCIPLQHVLRFLLLGQHFELPVYHTHRALSYMLD